MPGRAWAAVALVAVTPVVVDAGGFHRYVALRFVFVALAIAAGAAAAVRQGVRIDSPITALFASGVVVSLASVVASPDPLLGVVGDPVRMMGLTAPLLVLGAFLIGAHAGGTQAVATGLLAGGAVVVVVGVAQLVGVGGHTGRVTATLGNAGFLGAFLCLMLPVAIARTFAATSNRAGLAALSVGGGTVLVASGSRGAWIGVAAGLTLLAALRRQRGVALLAGAAIVGMVVLVPLVSRETGRGRVDTWQETADVLARRPVLGWGPEGFRRGFAEEMSPAWVRQYSLDQIPDRAHNRMLDIAASTGAAGLVVDVALIGAISARGRRLLRALEPSSPAWWQAAGVVAALVAWLVQGQFLFDTFDLVVVAAVLVGSVVGRGELGIGPRLLLPVAAVGLAVVALAGVNLYADRLVASGSGKAAPVAFDKLERAIEIRPRALDVHLLLAEVAIRSQDRDLLEDAHSVLRKWDDDAVRIADARVLAGLGHLADARAMLRDVLRRQPANTRASDALTDLGGP